MPGVNVNIINTKHILPPLINDMEYNILFIRGGSRRCWLL